MKPGDRIIVTPMTGTVVRQPVRIRIEMGQSYPAVLKKLHATDPRNGRTFKIDGDTISRVEFESTILNGGSWKIEPAVQSTDTWEAPR